MGRKKNTSQPMLIDIMLSPLTESFQIVPSDTLQQWYYTNNEGTSASPFSPNRETQPLFLTPTLTVFDPDTQQTYTPSFGTVRWFYLSAGSWVEITATPSTQEQSAMILPYVVYPDGRLKVSKNVNYDSPVTLLCECTYIDPRDISQSTTIKETVVLSTNRDATVTLPTITIDKGVTQTYNPFQTASSQYSFTAKVMLNNQDITQTSSILWYVLNKTTGNETIINATTTVDNIAVPLFPCYVSGYNSATLVLDAMYAEDITVVARVVKTTTPSVTLYPCKAMCTLMWDDVPMDIIVSSNNSGAVRSDTKEMTFDTIINMDGKYLTDAQKTANMLFNWKRRSQRQINGSNPSVIDCGWGQHLKLGESEVNQYKTTLVYSDAYLMGAYEVVTDNGEIVTDGGEAVYDRS